MVTFLEICRTCLQEQERSTLSQRWLRCLMLRLAYTTAMGGQSGNPIKASVAPIPYDKQLRSERGMSTEPDFRQIENDRESTSIHN